MSWVINARALVTPIPACDGPAGVLAPLEAERPAEMIKPLLAPHLAVERRADLGSAGWLGAMCVTRTEADLASAALTGGGLSVPWRLRRSAPSVSPGRLGTGTFSLLNLRPAASATVSSVAAKSFSR